MALHALMLLLVVFTVQNAVSAFIMHGAPTSSTQHLNRFHDGGFRISMPGKSAHCPSFRPAHMSMATASSETEPIDSETVSVPVDGLRAMGSEGEAHLKLLLEKCTDKTMQETWRRAAFWENETATLLEVVNVLGRFETCNEWTERLMFVSESDLNAKDEDDRQALTKKRGEMAKRMGCGERAALFQNVPTMPFRNPALAKSVGLAVEDFERLPVTRSACNILYDGLAESRSTLIPYKVLDARRNAMINPDGTFNQVGFRLGWSKSCILFIVGLFIFGKANFIWILVGAKLLHDWNPELIPGPKELGLFKIWGIV